MPHYDRQSIQCARAPIQKLSGAAPHIELLVCGDWPGTLFTARPFKRMLGGTTATCLNALPCESASPAQSLSNAQEHRQEAESLLAFAD
jgi:hypothetical protein